ncbi:MAG: hypothetical protein LQ345_000644 [Seirophora villosa]|nr:MAG: hypothetical protein LQ345_000644 [Seirophora villosa]
MSSPARTHAMVTRFKGTKRPFLGERLEGTTPPPKPKRRRRAAKAKAKAKVTPKRNRWDWSDGVERARGATNLSSGV